MQMHLGVKPLRITIICHGEIENKMSAKDVSQWFSLQLFILQCLLTLWQDGK